MNPGIIRVLFAMAAAVLLVTAAAHAAAPTYSKDVAPILNSNCVVCHRPGEPVPMTLLSFEEVRPWAKSIKQMVSSRQMPPWHADPSVGEFKNERRLSEDAIATLVAWVDAGAPRGNPEEAPPIPEFTPGWRMGEPDRVFTIPEQVLPASLEDEYRYVTIPTGFKEDRWIEAAEVRPDNLDVVHHVIIFTAKPEALASGDGLSSGLGGYAPGSPPLVVEEGEGLLIEARSLIVLQMHYHKEPGNEERDSTSIGIRFARHVVQKQLRFGDVGNTDFVIPAGAANHEVSASSYARTDMHIEQIIPHMHLRGKDMRVWAEFPDGDRKELIYVPQYDFNWQTFYEYAEPIAIPAGTRLNAVAHYDNSRNNPWNPDPGREVRFGLPTTAEMMFAFYIYTVDGEQLNAMDPSMSGGD